MRNRRIQVHGIETYTGDRKRKSAMTFPGKQIEQRLDESTKPQLREVHTVLYKNKRRSSARGSNGMVTLTRNPEEEPGDMLHLVLRPFNFSFAYRWPDEP